MLLRRQFVTSVCQPLKNGFAKGFPIIAVEGSTVTRTNPCDGGFLTTE
jgi:hypothetical protein